MAQLAAAAECEGISRTGDCRELGGNGRRCWRRRGHLPSMFQGAARRARLDMGGREMERSGSCCQNNTARDLGPGLNVESPERPSGRIRLSQPGLSRTFRKFNNRERM